MGVERTENDGVPVDGDAAIVRAAAEDVLSELVLEMPELLAGLRIGGEDVIEGRRDVHDSVLDDRRILERADDAGLKDPFDPQPADVSGVDRLARPITLLTEVAAVSQPVLGLRSGFGDLVPARGIGRAGNHKTDGGSTQARLETSAHAHRSLLFARLAKGREALFPGSWSRADCGRLACQQ